MPNFPTSELEASHIPALAQLIKLGYQYLTPEQLKQERQQRCSNVLLENILYKQLHKINRIHHKGTEYLFSEANIAEAIRKLKENAHNNLHVENEDKYHLLTLGTALSQRTNGDTKSFTLHYIDWKNPENNAFHVVAEFSVERNRSTETVRPDIVLFINGIPVVVIECKAACIDVAQGIEQMIRNQGQEYIPHLFAYSQLLLVTNKNTVKYATAGTAKKFWSEWKEAGIDDNVRASIAEPLTETVKNALFCGDFAAARSKFEQTEGKLMLTEQDRALYSLCRPERLLELINGFIVFDNGNKKIARYQQFFVVRAALKRIGEQDSQGKRAGGIVWHTQGSGKSITMVMLARALAKTEALPRMRMLLVTDRIDLETQLAKTFAECGLDKKQATTGRNLVKHLKNKVTIITTLVHKFDSALAAESYSDNSADIVVLVDESHRTQYANLAGKMRLMLPKASYIGFTGTPLTKKEKDSYARFGGLIKPHYPMRQAVADKAVVPLLYEGRHSEMKQNKSAIDTWFERYTADLTQQQQADLKRKYACAAQLTQATPVIQMRAFDISQHFKDNWQGTGFKAQLVAPTKSAALRYHHCLEEFGDVSSAVIISAPDTQEGHQEVDEGVVTEVDQFWQKMMHQYGNEKTYNDRIIDRFKHSDKPEILIVVDKLITGFDAPLNTVLYLCRILRDHTLLQAVARVNRLHEGKEYGYIVDYENILQALNETLVTNSALADYSEEDLADELTALDVHVKQLPKRYAALCDLFKSIASQDEEAHERFLADDKNREDFYALLTAYGKTLTIAHSSEQFWDKTDKATRRHYTTDFKRFYKLRLSVKSRYADTVGYCNYDARIQKLLDMHIQSDQVLSLNEPVDIFDDVAFQAVSESGGVYENKARQADTIAHRLKRTMSEKMEEDPTLYKQFSDLVQNTIDVFRAGRTTPEEYFQQVSDLRDKFKHGGRDDVPEKIRDDRELSAYYGAITGCLSETDANSIAVEFAEVVQKTINQHWRVNFWQNSDAQRILANAIDDYFYDTVNREFGIALSEQKMNEIIAKVLKVAKFQRRPQ